MTLGNGKSKLKAGSKILKAALSSGQGAFLPSPASPPIAYVSAAHKKCIFSLAFCISFSHPPSPSPSLCVWQISLQLALAPKLFARHFFVIINFVTLLFLFSFCCTQWENGKMSSINSRRSCKLHVASGKWQVAGPRGVCAMCKVQRAQTSGQNCRQAEINECSRPGGRLGRSERAAASVRETQRVCACV